MSWLNPPIEKVIESAGNKYILCSLVSKRAKELLEESIQTVMKEECLAYAYDVVRVVPAELGESIGDYAALAVAANLAKERNI